MKASRRRGKNMYLPTRSSLALLGFTLVLAGLTAGTLYWLLPSETKQDTGSSHYLQSWGSREVVVIASDTHINLTKRDDECTYHSCLNVYHCGYHDQTQITLYVYPLVDYQDEKGQSLVPPISTEFDEILQTIAESPYYTSDPKTACLFIPAVDLLNQNNVKKSDVSRVLASLPWWNGGENHILFNMLPGHLPDFKPVLEVDSGRALVAGSGMSTWTYRRTLDVALPTLNPLVPSLPPQSPLQERHYLVLSSQMGLHREYRAVLSSLAQAHPNFLLLDRCPEQSTARVNFTQRCQGQRVFTYPDILQEASFCLVVRGARLAQPVLTEALMAGCIPIIVMDGAVLPFSEVLDWKRIALLVREEELGEVMAVAKAMSGERILEMRRQARFVWEQYFSSVKAVTLTTLRIINDRIFPYAARKYGEWNDIPNKSAVQNPLFLPLSPPKSQGFTAVILTFDRLESLFTVIKQVARVPSLAKVVVVWNNQNKAPPSMSAWPYIGKPVTVIPTKKNKLSNRFFPYDEIDTECILALDDDIVMLTADELEFGYEVWREFPDRIVGFPSRLHLWDNATQKWRYESEWTNTISMVLTGAAFYHKYYSYLYTRAMPGDVKAWVDEHMNCEDIAMNFLIANVTGKAPIKVTPRKKFKCPQCTNTEMLSANLEHMVERSECINRFASVYASMPLKEVEFRADPLLYKDDFPANLKLYNDIGSL